MKQLFRSIAPDGSGEIKLLPECAEDLWHAYNLVAPGDRVAATTLRKVQRDPAGGGGGDSERVKLKLCIDVEACEYDGEGGLLRLRGRNLTECEAVKLGAYHSLELEPHRAFSLLKAEWDVLHFERIKEACDPAAAADLAAVMLEAGLAHVCLVGGTQTVVRAKIETALPRKRGAAAQGYDKALAKFFEAVLQAVLRHVDFGVVRCLVLAGPGYTKDEFHRYLLDAAVRRELRPVLEHKASILTADASHGYRHNLDEVLASPAMARIQDTKARGEVQALEAFYAMLSDEPARAMHGPGHVLAADEQHAIQTLLLSDSLFRSAKPNARKHWVALTESVKARGGEVRIFSSAHPSGEQLDLLTGVAALLRFPLPALADAELPPPDWF